jgi:hypothetical protein
MDSLPPTRTAWIATLLALAILAPASNGADISVSSNAELSAALSAAVPGDRILLAPGTYANFSRANLNGITIRSADSSNPATINGGINGIFLSSAVNVTLEHLRIQNATANGINIDDGGSYPATRSRGITLRDLEIVNIGSTGNHDGIKLSGVDDFLIERVRISNWGAGGSAIDMVGCHHGVIQNNWITATNQSIGGSGIRPKGGTSDIDIVGNRVSMNSGRTIQFGGQTDAQFFRFLPGESGYEAARIRAAGNIVLGGDSQAHWVNIDGGLYRYNYFSGASTRIIRILNENPGSSIVDTRNGAFIDNMIVYSMAPGSVVNSGPETFPDTFTFARNQWYRPASPSNSTPTLPAPEASGVYGIDPARNPDGVVHFQPAWGLWLMNANLTSQTFAIDNPGLWLMAHAGESAAFDPFNDAPFIGNWTFSPLSGAQITVDPLSSIMLVPIPEPAAALLLVHAIAGLCLFRRRPPCIHGRSGGCSPAATSPLSSAAPRPASHR